MKVNRQVRDEMMEHYKKKVI